MICVHRKSGNETAGIGRQYILRQAQ